MNTLTVRFHGENSKVSRNMKRYMKLGKRIYYDHRDARKAVTRKISMVQGDRCITIMWPYETYVLLCLDISS